MPLRPVQLFFMATLLAIVAGAAGRGGAAEPTPAPFRMADGLAIEPFASEPLLANPADIDVDARGRVWVCEVVNYRGKKETRPEGDRILVLEDTDGDGRADRQTVFHQGRDVDSALGRSEPRATVCNAWWPV
jgi:glucose/arabinose dehydrogenase